MPMCKDTGLVPRMLRSKVELLPCHLDRVVNIHITFLREPTFGKCVPSMCDRLLFIFYK
ncbi:hypothetical protein B0O99DRAFT_606597 [Bisporella sp. PMI_857]|nr:hypothetical protein B0O99DRAFT_606597 [Bisporella sp. PMI_857]